MKINTLYVKNFKNIKEIYIDNFERVNCIQGENGGGKSAIVTALQFIITNSLNEKIEEYVRWGTDKFEIECDFDHNEYNYIYRIEGSKSCKRKLIINNGEEFFNSEAVKKLAEVIDPNLTLHSCVSEQGKTTQLLFQTPAERLKTIKQILKFDSIFDAVDNIKTDMKKKDAEVEKIDVEQNVLKAREYSYIPTEELRKEVLACENIEDKIKLQEDIKRIYDENKLKKVKYESDLKIYNEKLQEIKQIDFAITSTEDTLKNLEKKDEVIYDDTEFKSLLSVKEDLQAEQIKYNNDKKNYDEAQKSLKEVVTNIEKYTAELSAIKLERLQSCKYNDTTIEVIQGEINTLKVDLYKKNNELTLAKEGKCSKCGTDLSTKFNTEELEKEIKVIESTIKEKETEQANQKKEIADYQEQVEKQKHLSNTKASLNEKISIYTTQKEKYESVVEPTIFDSHALEVLNKQIEEQSVLQKQIEEQNKTIRESNNLFSQLESKLNLYIDQKNKIGIVAEPKKDFDDSLIFNEEEYNNLKKQFAIQDQKKAELKRAEEFNEKLKAEQKENDKKVDSNDKLKESIQKQIGILRDTSCILEKDFSSHCIDTSIGFIRDKMNQFFQRTYPKYKVTVKQDKNSVTFFYQDEVLGVEAPCSMASGAERDILAIANRVALSSIQDLGILILDEIDSQMSEQNSYNLFKQLIDQQNIEQIFCITHCEGTKEMFESNNETSIYEVKEGELI